MHTQRIATGCVIAAFVLFSCQHKKNVNENSPQKAVAEIKHDTTELFADTAIAWAQYANDYITGSTTKFTVSPTKISVINGKKGLRVTVNPASLETMDGAALNGKINVSLVELTSSDELFKANAATISDGRLLTSGGSYFIGMECGGQPVRIRQGKSLAVNFKKLTEDEMELFYGERDGQNNMNWKKAGQPLRESFEEISFTDTSWNPGFTSGVDNSDLPKGHIYKSLDALIYYYDQPVTIRRLIDTLNKTTAKLYVDTISFWPKDLPTNQKLDTNYLINRYGPRYMFRIISCKDYESEQLQKAFRKQAIDRWQNGNLVGQFKKYYAMSTISSLGWINCDRFYDKEQTQEGIDIPITLSRSAVNYFVIFRSANGLLNGKLYPTVDSKHIVSGLPIGEEVTLVAFIKKDGIIYQSKEDFVVKKNKKLPARFKQITTDEMKKMFGANVSI